MLKRILASIALTSILLGVVLLVYWWRSSHGHSDSFTMGKNGASESHFYTVPGKIIVEVTDKQTAMWNTQSWPYPFKNVLGYFLIVPCLWVAVKVRGYLPRPPGRELKIRTRIK